MVWLGFSAAALVLVLSGCATAPIVACRGSQRSMLSAELLFGRKSADRIVVTEREWAGFVEQEITPRFPDGLTVLDATGQWRDPAVGRAVREPSKIVIILFRDDPAAHERLDAIAEAYKRRFDQRSVGIVIKPACASF
jgi:Protein of unknown function (DUF3574)